MTQGRGAPLLGKTGVPEDRSVSGEGCEVPDGGLRARVVCQSSVLGPQAGGSRLSEAHSAEGSFILAEQCAGSASVPDGRERAFF